MTNVRKTPFGVRRFIAAFRRTESLKWRKSGDESPHSKGAIAKLLFVLCTLLVLAGNTAAAEKELDRLHVLMVLDTSDKDLKPTLDVDRARFLTMLLLGLPEQRMPLKLMEGKNANLKNVLSYYENAEGIKRDGSVGLLFYFSGHGATVENTRKHVLMLSGSGKPEFLERDKLREAMQKLNPGLAIIITDSCSSYIPHLPGPNFVPEDIRSPKNPLAGYRRLFFESRGLVDITAAREGTLAWSDVHEGGIFTRAIVKNTLAVQDSDSITWEKLALQLRTSTPEIFKDWKKDQAEKARKANEVLDRDLLDQRDQVPQIFALPGNNIGLLVDATDGNRGVKVTDVFHASAAQEAGVHLGDRILKLDGAKIATPAEFDAALKKAQSGSGRSLVLAVETVGGEQVDRVLKLK